MNTLRNASKPNRENLAQKSSARNLTARAVKVLRYESQEELFFACTSLVLLLLLATADVLVRVH